MAQDDTFDFMDQEQLKEIIRYIEEPDRPKPGTIKDAPLKDLGRVIELGSEFLVVMPPNLALRMPNPGRYASQPGAAHAQERRRHPGQRA